MEMSLFKKVLASIGIGSAKVDARLENTAYRQGDVVNGVIYIQGGDVEQFIEDVYMKVYTQYVKEVDDHKVYVSQELVRHKVKESFVLGKGEKKEFSFSLLLPYETPITAGRVKVWVQTELGISNAIDPTDKDYISVTPSPVMEGIFSALEDMGFRIHEAECKKTSYQYGSSLPFLQEFEFKPYRGSFRGKLDEVEVTLLHQDANETEIYLQIDRKARGIGGFLSEILETDETNLKLSFTPDDISNMKHKMHQLFHRYS